jgi:hypothetical protein
MILYFFFVIKYTGHKYTIFLIGDNKGGVKAPFKLAKNDLIAELKASHNVGGVGKLRSEQQKMQEEQERAEYRRFLAQFTAENFLEKVSFQCMKIYLIVFFMNTEVYVLMYINLCMHI